MVRSSASLHEQVRLALTQEINAGKYDSVRMLPAEPELCKRFGVSRITVRRAVSDLEDLGLVRRRQGAGTFVTGGGEMLGTMTIGGFADKVTSGGTKSRSVKRSDVTQADATTAQSLQIETGDTIFRLERVFLLNDVPLSLDRSVYSLDRFPDFQSKIGEETSTYQVLREQYGVRFAEVRREVRIGYTTRETAEWLQMPEHDPLIVVEKVALDPDGEVIHISHVETAPSRVKLSMVARDEH
ncbi:GntR family transcriptional regulator [Paramicrobacterium chengjingii]|uniref:GntR family transcriptional regulator n=1 Tax=Paramicrobacterium chengjingii TaxID=2769067 RepID=A0ABX6YHG1_9MICO|nr:GntR family transcriptional regulator [Microbacterium chengjingii]QPZ38227.1 GntR family transcriptional regulator [Microbacterium chengjingii]